MNRTLQHFAPVTQRHDRLLVLASGPSGAGPWQVHPGVPVIAVNGAIDTLAWDPDYWITLDPSPANRARFERPRAGTRYFIAVDRDWGATALRQRMRQDFAASGAHLLLRRRGLGLPADTQVIHIGTSGSAGVQLALHMARPGARVGVLGVDATDDDYWHAPGQRSEDLTVLPEIIRRLRKPGVSLAFGTCPGSRITGQRMMAPGDLMAWLRG